MDSSTLVDTSLGLIVFAMWYRSIDLPDDLPPMIEVARLSNFGTAYFGSIDNWNTWLHTPNIQFDNQPTRAIMNSVRGRELIRRVISGLQHGFTA